MPEAQISRTVVAVTSTVPRATGLAGRATQYVRQHYNIKKLNKVNNNYTNQRKIQLLQQST